MENVQESFDIIKFKMNSHQQNIELLTKNVSSNKALLDEAEKRSKILDNSKNILTILKNYKMESKKDFILKTINTALADVFNQNLRIDIEATSATSTGKINMKYDIVLYQNEIEMARNEKLLGNNGGGVLSFISILFKVLVGYIYSDNKFFLFDESIAQVSPMYRPRIAQFLRKFCEEYNFTLVLISQTDDIDEYAHVGYYLDGTFDDNGVPVLHIDKIMGTYPEDQYVYTKIKNFQSIVDLEFRYKGFTVIRGNNNIGKSASFRAVNAILFNTFDSKDHPRKKRPRGSETKIVFGFYDTKSDNTKKISLTYKSNKVVYEFDGNTFSGKNLAFDKVKEKVESIGFKYVNLKETYRNFKGNLKDQTERLAMTTQHDGFYLVGNKNNETEKVFNFLFDSTEVANAIANITIDINIKHNLINELTEKIKDETFKLQTERLNYNIYVYKYYIFSIKSHISNITQLNSMLHTKASFQKIIDNIDGYVSIMTGLSNLEAYKNNLDMLNSNNAVQRSKIIDTIISYETYIELFNKYFLERSRYDKILNTKAEYTKNIQVYDTCILYLTNINTYNYYINAFNKYFTDLKLLENLKKSNKIHIQAKIDELIQMYKTLNDLQLNIKNLETFKSSLVDKQELHYSKLNDLSNLDKQYNIHVCPHCGGTGYCEGEI